MNEYINALYMEGYEVNNISIEFFKEFAGIEVIHPHHILKNENDSFIVNPKLVTNYFFGRIKEYEERVCEQLTPIGKAYSGYMILSMSSTGKLYAGYDDSLIRLGNNGYEAIQTLCEGLKTIEIDALSE